MHAKALARCQEQHAYALRQYQQAEPKTKLQLTRWEMLRWAVNALNVVLAARKEALVELPAAPWALTPQEVFEASYESQQRGFSYLTNQPTTALAA